MCFAQWTCSSQKSTVGSEWRRTRLYWNIIFTTDVSGHAPAPGSHPVSAIDFPAPEPGPNYLTTLERIKNCLQTSQWHCLQPHTYLPIIHIIILYVYCVRTVWFWFYWQHCFLCGFCLVMKDTRMCVCVCVFITQIIYYIYIQNILLFIPSYRRL